MNKINSNCRVQSEKEKRHKKRVQLLLVRVGLLAMLLILSTYAWFTSQKDITLSNIRGTVEVVENMEISLDAKTWYQKIDLSDAVNVFAEAQTSRNIALEENTAGTGKTTDLAVIPSQMLPVSGVAKTGVTLLPLYVGEATSTSLTSIAQCAESEINIAGDEIAVDSGYFAFDMYIKNTSRDDEADALQLNINSSVQVLTETINKTITDITGNEVDRTYNGNDASGLQNTVRVALAKYDGEITSTATQKEILESTKEKNILDVAIWEPNAYDHVEAIVSNNNKLINSSNTNTITFTDYHPETPLETYALNENAVGETIDNVYNIASTGLGAQNTFKTDNIKNGAGEIESYRIKTENDTPINIKNTSGNNFEISANTVTRYRVYVWLEGQDVDCINIASLGGGIELDLGLTKDNETGDVLVNADNRVAYSTLEQTSSPVTATITMEEEITPLPEGWTYVDAATKLSIQKEYENNSIEQVKVSSASGNISTIEVAVANIDTEPSEFTETVSANPKDNYGLYTNYPVDIDGDATNNDWQIFYADGENVFLKADNYVPNAKIKTGVISKGETEVEYVNDEPIYTSFEKYGVYWDEDGSNFNTNTIEEKIINKYLLTQAVATENNNYKTTASLLNTNNWNNFVNPTYADSAVGGPTVEMWAESWNQKYEGDSNYSQIFYEWDSTENLGYKVGTAEGEYATEVLIQGYTNAPSYFPCVTDEGVYDVDGDGTMETCFGYWIASPAYNEETSETWKYNAVLAVAGNSNGGGFALLPSNFGWIGLCPVVCLDTSVNATLNGDVWELSE